jgi:hypothetical protein
MSIFYDYGNYFWLSCCYSFIAGIESITFIAWAMVDTHVGVMAWSFYNMFTLYLGISINAEKRKELESSYNHV